MLNLSSTGGTISGVIEAPSQAVAETFSEPVSLDYSRYHYLIVSATSEPSFSVFGGFAYGIRFVGQFSNGTKVQLSADKLPNEHIASGGMEGIPVYLPSYGYDISRIIAIEIYVEERPGISSPVQLTIHSITAAGQLENRPCVGKVCYAVFPSANFTGHFDALATNVIASGQLTYRLLFAYNGTIYASRPYLSGTSYVTIVQSSRYGQPIPGSLPTSGTSLYIVANTTIQSVQLDSLKIVLTSSPTFTLSADLPASYLQELLLAEVVLVFLLPTMLILLKADWKVAIATGIAIRLLLMPWTGQSADIPTWIRTAYLYFHQGWAPIFYNPPTYSALALPTSLMSYYYLLGLDRVDPTFLYHWGGVIANAFVKVPFFLADLGGAYLLFKLSERRIWGVVYFLNPLTIFVSAIWGQYESVELFALLLGYLLLTRMQIWRSKVWNEISAGLAFLMAGLVELFGFIVLLFYMLHLVLQRSYKTLGLVLGSTTLVILVSSGLREYILSFLTAGGFLRPSIYSLPSLFGSYSTIPALGAIGFSLVLGAFLQVFGRKFAASLLTVLGVAMAFNLFGTAQPQVFLLVLGLSCFYFATKGDDAAVPWVLLLGGVVVIIIEVGTQSLGYVLTGAPLVIFPQTAGNHLNFYLVSYLVLNILLIIRLAKRIPIEYLVMVTSLSLSSLWIWQSIL